MVEFYTLPFETKIFLLKKAVEIHEWSRAERGIKDHEGLQQLVHDIIKTAEEGGRIVGYSVIRVNRYSEEYPGGYIVDLLTLPDRLDVASDLISDAIRCFDDKNVNIIRTWVVKGHPFEQLFKLHGFLDTRWPPSMQIESLNVGTEWEEFITSTADRLYFQYGHTDWICCAR